MTRPSGLDPPKALSSGVQAISSVRAILFLLFFLTSSQCVLKSCFRNTDPSFYFIFHTNVVRCLLSVLLLAGVNEGRRGFLENFVSCQSSFS